MEDVKKSQLEKLNSLIDEAYDDLIKETDLAKSIDRVNYLKGLEEIRDRWYNPESMIAKEYERMLADEKILTERRSRELMDEKMKLDRKKANADIIMSGVKVGTDKAMEAAKIHNQNLQLNEVLGFEETGHPTGLGTKTLIQNLLRNK